MSDYAENMSVDRSGRFFSPSQREVEYLRYPFTLTSQISGVVKRIKNRDDLRQFLIAEKDDGAVFDIGDILDWVDDQTTWNGTTKISKHEYQIRQMVDPGFLFLG